MNKSVTTIWRFGRGSGSRLAILFLALALTWQGFLTQGHAHFDGGGRIVAAATSAASFAAKSKPAPVKPACPLCEEQALFGAFLLATPAQIVVPDAAASWYAPTSYFFSTLRSLSHSWRSRAPPRLTT